jgi:hypothetical protein
VSVPARRRQNSGDPEGTAAPAATRDPGPARAHIPAEERIARERRLRRAILIEAIRCLEGTSGSCDRAHLRRQALNWLRGINSTLPFSFLNICESLGLDPASVRREVLMRFGRANDRLARNRLADVVREPRGTGRRVVPPPDGAGRRYWSSGNSRQNPEL